MVPGKDQIVLHASTGFKDALGKYATEHKTSMAEVIREAVAKHIGYDMTNEPARTRAPKYETPEEAKRAALDRAALIRWGSTTSAKLLNAGETEAALLVARATSTRDYEVLQILKSAATPKLEEEDASEASE